VAHFATWREQAEGLERTLDWVARVGANLNGLTYDERRATLMALRATVRLYRTGHEPRVELEHR
jgi:hypothetical protein